MAETLRNTTDGRDKKFLDKVKTAAAILVTALGLTVAVPQDANAQMFNAEETKTEIAEKRAEGEQIDEQNAQKDNTIAEIDEDIEGQNETIAERTEVRAENNETIAEIDKETIEWKEREAKNEKIIAGLR